MKTWTPILLLAVALAGCTVEHRADCTTWRFLDGPPHVVAPAQNTDGFPSGPVRNPADDANQYQ